MAAAEVNPAPHTKAERSGETRSHPQRQKHHEISGKT